MKCDELKWKWAYGPYLDPPEGQKESAIKAGYVKVVSKQSADEAIAELKAENERIKKQSSCTFSDDSLRVRQLKRKIADNSEKILELQKALDVALSEVYSLLDKIESLKASHYAESVDAGMRERRLRRALWIARAKRAIDKIAWFKLWNASISTMNPEDGARQEYDKWKKALGKFLAKAEEYK